ncbi:hypothetical protein OIO90_000996 [Microbotryomycetes sp. JL221]|nr:hypothetical protein OIO90_000996 [Microbotryomycetes sp. JL221]
MAPVPNPDAHKSPPLHLKCLDLSHKGSRRFFSRSISPYDALDVACQQVLRVLYPSRPRNENGASSNVDATTFEAPAIRSITLHLAPFDGIAYTCGSDIDFLHKELHLSTKYLTDVDEDRVDDEIKGVMVHELVHAFQWDGSKHGGGVPGGVIEGIADWVRLKVQLAPPHWHEGGDKWDAGYQTTAYFLAWLERRFQRPTLVPELNMALKNHGWDDGKHLKRLCGGEKPQDLWQAYLKELRREESAPAPVPTHRA